MSPIFAQTFDGLGTDFALLALWAFLVFVPWLTAAIYSIFALALLFDPQTLKDSKRFAMGSMKVFLVSVGFAFVLSLISYTWRGQGGIYNSALALVIYFAPLAVGAVVNCRGRSALKRNDEKGAAPMTK